MEQDYLDEIAQYIMKNRGSGKKTIESSHPSKPSFTSSSTVLTFCSVVYPETRLIQHFKLPTNGILKKLREFNSSINGSDYYTLTQDDFILLENLIITLGDEQSIMQPLDVSSISLIQKLLLWPMEKVYPALDILKNCVLRPNGLLMISSAPGFDFESMISSLQ